MEEKPLTNPLALMSSWALVSPSMDAGLDQAPFSPSKTAWKTSDAVEKELEPHHVGPPRLAAEGDGGDAGVVELRHQAHDVAPGLGRLGADLVEDLLVPVEHDGLDRLGRHGVDLAVDRRGPERGREQPVLDRGVLAEPRGEVLDLAGLDVAAQTAAAPAPDDRGRLAGPDGRLDLRLVGVVLEGRRLDLGLGVGLVEPVNGSLADLLAGRAGEEPVGGRAGGGAAAASAAAFVAGAGAAAAGECQPGGAACGQAKEVPPRQGPWVHGDLPRVESRGLPRPAGRLTR